VFVRRSHVVEPWQTGAVYVVQSAPVHSPAMQRRPPHDGPLLCHVPLELQLCGCDPVHWT
jgi:hypothetical protein